LDRPDVGDLEGGDAAGQVLDDGRCALLDDDIADIDWTTEAAAAATPAPTAARIVGGASARAQHHHRREEGDASALELDFVNHRAANFDCRSRLQAPAACDAGNMNMDGPLG